MPAFHSEALGVLVELTTLVPRNLLKHGLVLASVFGTPILVFLQLAGLATGLGTIACTSNTVFVVVSTKSNFAIVS